MDKISYFSAKYLSILNQSSEFEENFDLEDQKFLYLEKQLEEFKKNKIVLEQEIESLTVSHSTKLKDLQSHLESQLKTSEQNLTDEREAKLTLKKDLEIAENKISSIQSAMNLEVAKLQSRIEEISSQNKELTQIIDNKDKEFQIKMKENEKTIEENVTKNQKQIVELDNKSKKIEESLKADLSESDKINSELSQKNNLLSSKLKKVKIQLDEERKQSSIMTTSLNFITDSSKNLELEIQVLKEKHVNEIKLIESEIGSTKNQLLLDIQNLTLAKNDIELRYKLESCDWLQRNENLSEDIRIFTNEKEKLKNTITELKKQFENTQEDLESRYKLKVINLEKQIDEITETLSNEIQQEKKTSEEYFVQLKDTYESEKKRLESRLVEEKEKYDKRLKNLTQDYEEKIKQDQENFEDELECKDQKLADLKEDHEKFKHELLCKDQQIRELKRDHEKFKDKFQRKDQELKELKREYEKSKKELVWKDQELKELNRDHEKFKGKFECKDQEVKELKRDHEKLKEEFKCKDQELRELKRENEKFKNDFDYKDQELKEIKRNYENFKDEFGCKDRELKELKRDYENFKGEFQRKDEELKDLKQDHEKLKNELEIKEQELIELKQKSTESVNLLKNQTHLDQQKIESLEGYLKDFKSQNESQERKYYNLIDQNQAKFNQERTLMQEKLDKLNLELSSKEKDLTMLSFQKQQIESQYSQKSEELKDLKSELENLKTSFNLESEDLKQELASIKALLDRERTLWDSKFKFLSEQKDSAKSDLAEAQRKFEFTLQQLQKREQLGKEMQESSLNSLVSSIEARYTTKVKDLQDFSNSTIEHLNLKIKLLEQESKGLKEELEIARKEKYFMSGSLDKKCKKLQEVESKLIAAIESLKVEKERKNKEILKMKKLDRDTVKEKIMEMEKKIKEAESLKNSIELEKERSKWQMDKDNLIAAKNEALEKYETLQSKQENLLRENERMRTEKLKNRSLVLNRLDRLRGGNSPNLGSTIKFHDFSKYRLETGSVRNDSTSSYFKNSFAD